MKGQWLGKFYDGKGKFIINLDEKDDKFCGVTYILPEDNAFPSLCVNFYFPKNNTTETIDAKCQKVMPLRSDSLTIDSPEVIKSFYPDMSIPSNVSLSFEFQGDKMKITSRVGDDIEISGLLEKASLNFRSVLDATDMTWSDFKNFVLENHDGHIYRGQNLPWKLQTSFHRRGRYDLSRYQTVDIPQLHRALSSRTKHVFNLNIPLEHGAFLNLAQHHGYPTPLLDWSESPYVAAYFAFRGISKQQSEEQPHNKVRIYVFDSVKWGNFTRKNEHLVTGQLHLSLMDLHAIDNNRMIPQQATTMVTNVHDIELFVQVHEHLVGQKFLKAIDIAWGERDLILRELTLMGLTAGSLFPGLDGTCEELKEKMFD